MAPSAILRWRGFLSSSPGCLAHPKNPSEIDGLKWLKSAGFGGRFYHPENSGHRMKPNTAGIVACSATSTMQAYGHASGRTKKARYQRPLLVLLRKTNSDRLFVRPEARCLSQLIEIIHTRPKPGSHFSFQ